MGKNVNKSGKVWVQKDEKNQDDYERKIQEAVQKMKYICGFQKIWCDWS